MNAFLKILHLLFLLLIIFAAIITAFSGIEVYLLLSGQVQPGDSIYVDETAPTLDEALGPFIFGLIGIVIFSFARSYTRKRLKEKTQDINKPAA